MRHRRGLQLYSSWPSRNALKTLRRPRQRASPTTSSLLLVPASTATAMRPVRRPPRLFPRVNQRYHLITHACPRVRTVQCPLPDAGAFRRRRTDNGSTSSSPERACLQSYSGRGFPGELEAAEADTGGGVSLVLLSLQLVWCCRTWLPMCSPTQPSVATSWRSSLVLSSSPPQRCSPFAASVSPPPSHDSLVAPQCVGRCRQSSTFT